MSCTVAVQCLLLHLPTTKVVKGETPNELLGCTHLMPNTVTIFSVHFLIPAEHLYGEQYIYTKIL